MWRRDIPGMPKIKVLCGLGRDWRRKSFGPTKNQKNETRALGLHNELDQPNQEPRLATARTNWTMTPSYWQQPRMPPCADDGMNGRHERMTSQKVGKRTWSILSKGSRWCCQNSQGQVEKIRCWKQTIWDTTHGPEPIAWRWTGPFSAWQASLSAHHRSVSGRNSNPVLWKAWP